MSERYNNCPRCAASGCGACDDFPFCQPPGNAEDLTEFCGLHKCHPTECRGRHQTTDGIQAQYHSPSFTGPVTDNTWIVLHGSSGISVSRGMWQDLPVGEPDDYADPGLSDAERLQSVQRYLESRYGSVADHIRTDTYRQGEALAEASGISPDVYRDMWRKYEERKRTEPEAGDGKESV